MAAKVNARLLYTLLSATIVVVGAVAAIQYAKGNYRFTNKGFTKETGLLSANSAPTGAQVFINGNLVTATDDTLYLEPGTYDVQIVKDGYAPWHKTLTIEKELVAQTNALLLPSAPNLTSLTFTGVQNVSPSPDGQKILFYTASASAQAQNGLYVLEMGTSVLPFQHGPRQIATDLPEWNLKQAKFVWAPDSSEVLMITNGHQVLLNLDKKQDVSNLPDVGVRSKQILSSWEEEIYLRERQSFSKFPVEIIEMATTSAHNVYLSADKKRLLYTADKHLALPTDIVPPLPATNTQPEERDLQPNGVYVYDAEEDKNFRVGTEEMTPEQTPKHLLATDLFNKDALSLDASPSAFARLQATTSAQLAANFRSHYASLYTSGYQWFPDSKHLLTRNGDQVKVMEYDGTNNTVIYSGPSAENFAFPWTDGSKVVILTTFSPKSPFNLYAVELK